jgi:hypothetical protein
MPSECLSVETQDAHWGFRNRCNYTVDYAYCLSDIANAENACSTGAVSGTVRPNTFGILFATKNLKDEEHDFRWIGCNDEAGRMTARLVRTDPPAGQCVRLRSS